MAGGCCDNGSKFDGLSAFCKRVLRVVIAISVMLLLRYRNGDANVRPVCLRSLNDAIGNVAVIVAASGVWATGTA